MLASQSLIDAFNTQIGHELGASHQYTSIASYFDRQTLSQLAKFFYRQADEERDHAMRFVKFLVEIGAPVVIPEVPAPKADFDSAEEAVSLSLEWEETVTQQIYDLVEVAQKDSNHIAMRFLDWFVNEQLEEVSTMGGLLDVVRRAGADGLHFVEEYLAREGDPHA